MVQFSAKKAQKTPNFRSLIQFFRIFAKTEKRLGTKKNKNYFLLQSIVQCHRYYAHVALAGCPGGATQPLCVHFFQSNVASTTLMQLWPEVQEEQRNLSVFVFLVQCRLYYAHVALAGGPGGATQPLRVRFFLVKCHLYYAHVPLWCKHQSLQNKVFLASFNATQRNERKTWPEIFQSHSSSLSAHPFHESDCEHLEFSCCPNQNNARKNSVCFCVGFWPCEVNFLCSLYQGQRWAQESSDLFSVTLITCGLTGKIFVHVIEL